MSPEDRILFAVQLVFALLTLGAVVVFVIRPIWHMLRRTEEVEHVLKPFEPPPEEEIEIPVDPSGKKPDRSAMLEEARADPRRAAMIMQEWLREKKRGGRPTPPKAG